ncbi:MerR family transcriptional regulator [Paenibacillus sp. ACRRX]|nr:methyltransferase domain-containing protein [Paenibacillus sp. ACRRX]MCG7410402.1 MerR family transcriptional regulator [Paenibacillus sp. ACRRX]
MKIQEASRLLGMTPRSIRYYEERGLLAPFKKENNGYRVLTNDDMERLRMIGRLRELDLPIDDIQHCLNDAMAGELSKLRPFLLRKRNALAEEYVQMRTLMKLMDHMIHASDDMEGEQAIMELEQVTEQAKRVRELRLNWQDRWNFDKQAKGYDAAVNRIHGNSDVHADYERVLQRTSGIIQVKPGERGLDLGIGTGNLSARCWEQGALMTGVDQSEEMLKQCRAKWPEFRLYLGNMMSLPLADEKFDFIMSTYALHHLTEEQKCIALDEMDRVLVPGGRIAIGDLMFETEQHRNEYMIRLKKEGKFEEITGILDEYYADRSRLLAWWEKHGYEVHAEQLGLLVHLVYARKK